MNQPETVSDSVASYPQSACLPVSLSVCLAGSTSSERITTALYVYTYAYVHMLVYKRLSGPADSIN